MGVLDEMGVNHDIIMDHFIYRYGGGGGSRTRVRKPALRDIYVRSRWLSLTYKQAHRQADLHASSLNFRVRTESESLSYPAKSSFHPRWAGAYGVKRVA